MGAIACNSSTTTPNNSTSPVSIKTPDVQPGALVWGRYSDIESLDPTKITNILSKQVLDQIYDTLLTFDQQGQIRSNLAKSWAVSRDGKQYTFKLHPQIKCHDGTNFDAQAVKFNIDRAINPETGNKTRASWGPIQNVDVIDPLTVQVNFSEPFASFLPFLADTFSSMICPSSIDKFTLNFGNEGTIGTGPLKFDRWQQGEFMVLSPFAEYKNLGRPVTNSGVLKFPQLFMKIMPEAKSRWQALENGQINFTDVEIGQIDQVKANPQLTLHTATNTGQIVFLQFTNNKPFDQKNLREAVALAVNPEIVVKEAFANNYQAEKCVIPAPLVGNQENFCNTTSFIHDPERAKTILAEQGYNLENPLEVNLWTWRGDQRERAIASMEKQLATIGIRAISESFDIGTLNAKIKEANNNPSGKPTIIMSGWSWFDPDFLANLWGSPGFLDGFHNTQLDALLREMQGTTRPIERSAKITAVQQYLFNNAVMIPLYSPGWLSHYVSKNISGLQVGVFNRIFLNDVQVLPTQSSASPEPTPEKIDTTTPTITPTPTSDISPTSSPTNLPITETEQPE